MDALLMCGGRGTRLGGDLEKPLVEVGGEPMIDRVISALDASAIGTTYAVTSPHAPKTRRHLEGTLSTIETPGDGYVSDLARAISRVDPPVLTVTADLPLLDDDAIDGVLRTYARRMGETADASTTPGVHSMTVCVPLRRKRTLGASVGSTPVVHDDREVVASGVNVVAGTREVVQVTTNDRFVLNVNEPADIRLVEGLL